MNEIAALIILAANSTPAAMPTCYEIDSESAIDRAFFQALPKSGIPYTVSSYSGLPCFADPDEARAAALRSKIEAENPHTCLTFEKAWNVPAVEAKLRAASIPVWRATVIPSGRITMCHLNRDSAKVKEAIHEVFPDLK